MSVLGRLWRWMRGSSNERPRRNALDVYIELREAEIDELRARVALYEEKLGITQHLRDDERRREEGGQWTGPGTR